MVMCFQNEKCHLLIEHETQKLKSLDESHNQHMKEWRDKLRPRKKVRPPGCEQGVLAGWLARGDSAHSSRAISNTALVLLSLLKALEDELNQKKREQEMFFKLSEEADGQVPVSPTKHAKFVPFSSSESL